MVRRFTPAVLVILLGSCSTSYEPVQPDPESSTVSAVAAAAVPEAKPGQTEAREVWRADYRAMNSALALSDDERTRLESALKGRESALAKWMAEKGDALKDLERQMAQAAKARDLAAVQQLVGQAQPLRSELRTLGAAQAVAVRNALSADNPGQMGCASAGGARAKSHGAT